MPELFLQLLTAASVVAFVMAGKRQPVTAGAMRPPYAILGLAALVVALPLVQLVPLPPGIWHGLPGREAAQAALAIAGAGDRWMPLTLDRPATVASLLSLGPPLAVMLMVASIAPRDRALLLLLVGAVGIVTVLIGAGQMASEGALRIYQQSHTGWVTGLQANRNSTADVLAIAIIALAASAGALARRGVRGWWVAGAIGFMALGLILTGSRGGILLLVPVLLWALYLGGGFATVTRRTALIALALLAMVGVAGVIAVRQIPVLAGVTARFDADSDFRFELWKDGWQAAQAYWPVGGGMGGFVHLFLPFERLEVVDTTSPNRAHNDYLELLIEAGAIGYAVLAIAAAALAFLVIRAWRKGEVPRNHRLFSIGAIAVVAAHSLVDYPLRTMSLACLFALAAAMLTVPRSVAATDEGMKA